MDYYPIVLALTPQSLVGYAGGIGGAILAVFLIYAIVKDGIAYAKGGGSIFPIIGKALFLVLCIGLIFVAINYSGIGKKAETLANKAITVIDEQGHKILDGQNNGGA